MDHYTRSARNWLVDYGIDRLSHRRRDEDWVARQLRGDVARVVPVWRSRNLLVEAAAPRAALLAPRELGAYFDEADTLILLGADTAGTYFAVDLPGTDDSVAQVLSSHGTFRDLRSFVPLLDPGEAGLLAYARAMTYWHRHHRYCGDCGNPTRSVDAGYLRVCCNEACERRQFPRTDPAIIVLITHEERCLLARARQWRPHLYSTVAGFVEPGESIEEALAREVQEETSLRLWDIHYHSSQPWPFPSSLMLGFTARAKTTQVHLADGELEDARWFSRGDIAQGVGTGMLALPFSASIAYRLLEDWYDGGGSRLRDLVQPS